MSSIEITSHMDVVWSFLIDNIHRHRLPLPNALGTFKRMSNRHERVNFAYNYFSYLEPPTDMVCSPKVEKSDDQAVQLREKGNQMFRWKNCLEALQLYTQSIAHAKNDSSHLGLAYGNRSAVLFEKGYYKECLEDITRALQSNFPDHLIDKVLKRQKMAQELQTNHPKSFRYHERAPDINNKHPRIAAAADCVELKRNDTYGTHIVTTRDVQAGELISVEKPFATTVSADNKYLHCHECVELCYAMIPCENCATALYCSPECRTAAFKSYHRYECNFGNVANGDPGYLKTTLLGAMQHKNFDKEAEDDMYRSDRYREVYNLENNESKLDIVDHFTIAVLAGTVFYNLKERTNFLRDYNLEENMIKDMLLQNILVECTNALAIMQMRFVPDDTLQCYFETRDSDIGLGIYPFTSRYNHSCAENCARTFHGTICAVTAFKDLKKGEQCTIMYGFDYKSDIQQERQKRLRERYFFVCKCIACENFYPCYPHLSLQSFVLILGEKPDLIKLSKKLIEIVQDISKYQRNLPKAKRKDMLRTYLAARRYFTEPSEGFAFISYVISNLYALSGNFGDEF